LLNPSRLRRAIHFVSSGRFGVVRMKQPPSQICGAAIIMAELFSFEPKGSSAQYFICIEAVLVPATSM